ncbi:MAG TPA: SRPBCC domain-containing protein, partial [Phenylobacterium sp.]
MTATARASRIIPAKPAEVWETLTSRDAMKVYMMGAEVDTDWRVGHPITMRGAYNGKPYEDHGEIRSFEPWKR